MKSKLTKFALAAIFGLALTFTFSCSSGGGSGGGGGNFEYGSLPYKGKNYKTIEIGNQTWMAENLNYNVKGTKCYGEGGKASVYDAKTGKLTFVTLSSAEIQANCTKYGRLYTWAAAMDIDVKYNEEEWGDSDLKHQGICPNGWHIPSKAEWDELINYVESENGCSDCAGEHLMAKNGWWDGGHGGLDTYGFSALPGSGGDVKSDDQDGYYFGPAGFEGYWWSSLEGGKLSAYLMHIFSHENVYMDRKDFLYSVRCLKDD